MQIILVEPNEIIKDLLAINIKTYLGVDVIVRQSSSEAVELMKILPEIDLVITYHGNSEDNAAHDIASHILDNNLETPLIILGEVPKEPKGIETIANYVSEDDWEKTIELSSKLLGITEDVLKKKVAPEYIPIHVNYFLQIDNSCCDVYIRIKKDAGEFQFVKRIHKGDIFSNDVVKKYKSQGLKNFYIPKDQEKNFTIFISNELVKKLNSEFETVDEKIEVLANGYEIVTKEILKNGFDSATVQLTEGIVNNMLEVFIKEPKVSPLLRKILNSQSGYIYQHSHMTSVVACEILKNLGHKKKHDFEKMAYASFFKDISLCDKEDMAKISTFEQLEDAKLSEQDWDLVFNHALEGAILIRQYPEAPLDADNLIKHHHGSPNGKGFSVTGQVEEFEEHDLIFIIAVEFVNELMKFKIEGGKPRPIIDILKQKYTNSHSKRIIEALASTLQKSVKNDKSSA